MALNKHPTKTFRIEKAWLSQINRRFGEFKKVVKGKLKDLNKTAMVLNAAEPFALNPQQIQAFMLFYQQQINELITGTASPPNWQAQYQLQSYQRGIERGMASLRAQGINVPDLSTATTTAASLTPASFTATPSLATAGAIIQQPIHQESLEFLYSRSYDKLKGWTDAMTGQTREILTDGVQRGLGITEITKQMVERIGVAKSSAERIARTETIQSFQRAQINNATQVSDELGEQILVRWITADDGRVRDLHASWHGEVMTPQEAMRRINISPYNCRCATIDVIEEANTPEIQEKFDKEREQLIKVKEAEQVIERDKRAQKAVAATNPKNLPRPQGYVDADARTRQWIDAAFTDKKYNALVGSVASPRDLGKKGGGAYYDRFGGIHMASRKLGSNKGNATYRHEFGHHVDRSTGNATMSVEYERLRMADDKLINDNTKDYYKAAKKRHPDAGLSARYSRSNWSRAVLADIETERQLFNDSGLTIEQYVRANVKKGSPVASMLDNLNFDIGENIYRDGDAGLLRIVIADKYDNKALIAQTFWDYGEMVRNKWSEGGQIADLVGAMTNNRFGGGHGPSYYKIRRVAGIGAGNNSEAYAQIFSLNDKAATPAGAIMSEYLAPNMNNYFLEQLKNA